MKKRHIIIFSFCLLALWGNPHRAEAQFFTAKSERLCRTNGNGERRAGCSSCGQVDARYFRLLESHKFGFFQLPTVRRAARHEAVAL